MPAASDPTRDRRYLKIILDKIAVCRSYKPKFGQGREVSFEQFKELYSSDAFYSWFGLDNPLMYAAHKAAGGMTSLYRQIGIGCEIVFRQILRDEFGLTPEQANWSYEVTTAGGNRRRLSLDGRIHLNDVADITKRGRVQEWMNQATSQMGTDKEVASALKGVVFEVRQGYKSKDSKRQNADIGNAGTAYSQGYLPVLAVMSSQVDSDIVERYTASGWLFLRGYLDDSPLTSIYGYSSQILGYDLAGFFSNNSEKLKTTVLDVLRALLRPSDSES